MRHEATIDRLRRAVLDGPGELPRHVREALLAGEPAPEPFAGYVEKLKRHAYRITDREVEELVSATSEEAVFEATVAAALGAGLGRLEAGLAALEAAR